MFCYIFILLIDMLKYENNSTSEPEGSISKAFVDSIPYLDKS